MVKDCIVLLGTYVDGNRNGIPIYSYGRKKGIVGMETLGDSYICNSNNTKRNRIFLGR